MTRWIYCVNALNASLIAYLIGNSKGMYAMTGERGACSWGLGRQLVFYSICLVGWRSDLSRIYGVFNDRGRMP